MAIMEVIQRNEQLETAERQRVGRLVERVEKIKQRAAECGPRYCRFVNENAKTIIAKLLHVYVYSVDSTFVSQFSFCFVMCRLCGQSFGLLGPSKLICEDCQKPVCSKCSIELHSRDTTGAR